MEGLADRDAFAVVYPQGLTQADLGLQLVVKNFPSWMSMHSGYTWNAGTCCPGATTANTDDVGFARDLVAHLLGGVAANLSGVGVGIDPRRIYATGGSNGGFLSFRLACEVPELFAAVAPVAAVLANTSGRLEDEGVGSWVLDPFSCVARRRPVPTFIIQGDLDPLVPWTGNRLLGFRSATDNLAVQERLNGIPETDPGTVSFESGRTECKAYGTEASNVTLCRVSGMGHTWPSRSIRCMMSVAVDFCSTSLDASEQVWSFFKRYALDADDCAMCN